MPARVPARALVGPLDSRNLRSPLRMRSLRTRHPTNNNINNSHNTTSNTSSPGARSPVSGSTLTTLTLPLRIANNHYHYYC